MRRPRLSLLLFSAFLAIPLLVPAAASAQANPEVERLLKKFEHEPSIREVQAAAQRYAMVDSDRMDNWFTRVRLSNIIPGQITGRVELQDNTDTSVRSFEDLVHANEDDPSSPLVVDEVRGATYEDTDARVRYSLQGQWDVSSLIFNPDELRVSSEVSRLVKVREQVLINITKLYYERRRLQIEALLRPPTDAAEQVKLQLRIDELTADIDALTGGWFSENIQR